jgi:cell division transport system permease protein
MILGEFWRDLKSGVVELLSALIAAGLLFALGDCAVLATMNLAMFSSELKSESALEVFLIDEITESGIDSAVAYVSSLSGVSEVSTKDPEAAMTEMSAILGSDLTDILGFNPLPYSLEVKFEPGSYDAGYLNRISSELALRDEVMEVQYASEWLDNLERLTDTSYVITGVLLALVVISSLFIFVSLHRYISERRRDIVLNLRLLGISPWRLRTISVMRALIIGIVAGVAGIGITMLLWKLCCEYIVTVPFLTPELIVLVIAVPVVLALISLLISAGRSQSNALESGPLT